MAFVCGCRVRFDPYSWGRAGGCSVKLSVGGVFGSIGLVRSSFPGELLRFHRFGSVQNSGKGVR